MSLRRLFSSRSKSSSSNASPPIIAAGRAEKEEAHVDNLEAYDPKEGHPHYAYYKGYNAAKKHILEKISFQGVATESEIQEFVDNLLPNIDMADMSDDKKKELTEKGVRMALKHFGFLPPEY